MTLYSETKNFLIFVLLGLLFSLIFDIFRAIRKVKKPKKIDLYIQDIIYFLIVGIILIFVFVYIIDSNIRLYNMMAIILGVVIYISLFGNYIRNIFTNLFKINNRIISFLLLPIEIYKTIFSKQINKMKKFVINCCKKKLYMINFSCVRLKRFFLRKN